MIIMRKFIFGLFTILLMLFPSCSHDHDDGDIDYQPGFICKTKADYSDKVYMIEFGGKYRFDDLAKSGVLIPLSNGYYYNYQTILDISFSRLTQEEYDKGIIPPDENYLLDKDPFTEIWVRRDGENKGGKDSIISHYKELIINGDLNKEFMRIK